MVVAAGSRESAPLEPIHRAPKASPPAGSPDRPSLHLRERSSSVKNRKRETCTSGTVRDEDGNILICSARHDVTIHGLMRPASESRQGTNPRGIASLHLRERSSSMKNRKRESCTSGTVRDEDGNILIYSARHCETIHALGRPASEKRQGTKSRGVGHRRCSGRYG